MKTVTVSLPFFQYFLDCSLLLEIIKSLWKYCGFWNSGNKSFWICGSLVNWPPLLTLESLVRDPFSRKRKAFVIQIRPRWRLENLLSFQIFKAGFKIFLPSMKFVKKNYTTAVLEAKNYTKT